ncbi:hypothetical protein RI129_012883 [Pyrocoelia pectoralis]|uniref:Uncharacterized protein n=1 Tax=Pyrocoelia pectoralis TaxID=417401 RepID=A0AAN7ZGK8_9COLE
MNLIAWSLFAIIAFCVAPALQLPPDFQRCRRSDPNINECLKSAIERAVHIMSRGLPKFKIESIEPLKVSSMTIEEGIGMVRVIQNYKNCKIFNIASATVTNVSSTITDAVFQLNISAFLEDVYMASQYKLNGRVSMLSIMGEGDCTIKLKNEKANLHLIGEFTERNGKRYVEIEELKLKLDPEKVEMDFKNLFNGDPNLGPQINTIMNENWRQIFNDVGHAYEAALGDIFKNIANRIFKRIPYDELFLP